MLTKDSGGSRRSLTKWGWVSGWRRRRNGELRCSSLNVLGSPAVETPGRLARSPGLRHDYLRVLGRRFMHDCC